jgi:hypothetical protein
MPFVVLFAPPLRYYRLNYRAKLTGLAFAVLAAEIRGKPRSKPPTGGEA